MNKLNQNALIELQHIELELKNNRRQHLRHFIDQYYCYKNNHVNRNGNANWESLVWKGWVSKEAKSISDRKDVVKEHVVPISVITLLLEYKYTENTSLESIASVLDEYVVFATISKKEDLRLSEKKLTSKMPKGFWVPGDELFYEKFARYMEAEIELEFVES